MKGSIIRRKHLNSTPSRITYHYAIDVGDETVVQFHPHIDNNEKKELKGNRYPGIVTKQSKEGHDWEIVEKTETEHKANTIATIALEFVGKEMEYDLLQWNSQNFAYFCYEAKAVKSDQDIIDKKIKGASILGTTIVVASGAVDAAIAISTPAATIFGSEFLGSLAVSSGLMAAPTAPVWVPVAATVAAATVCISVGAVVAGWVSKTTSSSIPLVKETSSQECIICMEYNVCVRFLPCDHMIVCLACSNRVKKCPECRCFIEKKVQIFESMNLNNANEME